MISLMVIFPTRKQTGGDSNLDSRNRRRSDKEDGMVAFLMLSLLVTLCLGLNPVNLHESATGPKVATGQTAIAVYEARDFRSLVER